MESIWETASKTYYAQLREYIVIYNIILVRVSIYIAGAAKKYGIAHRSTVSFLLKWYRNNFDIERSNSTPVAEKETDKISIDSEQLQALKAELEFAKLKIIGLETLIDVAEEQLNIDIRKKPGTKQ